MARKRSKISYLAGVLNSTDQPIGILAPSGQIAYCNQPLADWTGCDTDELLGRVCRYHSTQKPGSSANRDPDEIAARLCPPPEAFQGDEVRALVTALDPDGWLQRRMARFIPIFSDENDLPSIPFRDASDDPSNSTSSDVNGLTNNVPNNGSNPARPSQANRKVAGLIVLIDSQEADDTATPTPSTFSIADAERNESDAERSSGLHSQLQTFHAQLIARYSPDRFIGNSPAMRRVRTQLQLAAQNRVHLSIIGPSGSGRQHVANAIHFGDASHPPGALFPVDCAVLGSDLIESTIRALADREPRNESPDRSTLLMLDVERLTPELQYILVSTMHERRFRLRVIGTSIKPLGDAVRAGRMRSDLAGMLTPIEIRLPSLFDRRTDIPLLTQAIIEQLNAENDRQISGLTSAALDLLSAYHWPGNLDELYTAITESHQRAESVYILPGDLPSRLRYATDAASHPVTKSDSQTDQPLNLDEHLANIERNLITRALQQSKGNRAEAARQLGLTRARLYRRIEQLGLE